MIRASVCMATFNGEKFILDQVNSILSQLGENDELVISDNVSTDSTVNIIKNIDDPRIKLFTFATKSVALNFQNAINHSNGRYIFFSDQDDIWLPGRLDEGLRLLEFSDVASVGLQFIDKDGCPIMKPNMVPNGGFLKNLVSNRYPGCCLSLRRSSLDKCLPFPPKIPMHDWWIILYLLCFGKVANSDGVYIMYRRHEQNVSVTGGKSNAPIMVRIKSRLILIYELLKAYYALVKK